MRIDHFLSHMKYCTRKEAQYFLKTHEVKIANNKIIHKNHIFDPKTVTVSIDGIDIFYKVPLHLMLYKPKGYVSATKDNLYPSLLELLKAPFDRFDFKIAGRLDVDTEGLIILSTDGDFVHRLTHPKKHLNKFYEVHLDQTVEDPSLLLKGVEIKDGKDQVYLATALDVSCRDHICHITIDTGKFHQVKRMFSYLGYNVIYLKRLQIGNLTLKNLEIGQYQEIEESECFD